MREPLLTVYRFRFKAFARVHDAQMDLGPDGLRQRSQPIR